MVYTSEQLSRLAAWYRGIAEDYATAARLHARDWYPEHLRYVRDREAKAHQRSEGLRTAATLCD